MCHTSQYEQHWQAFQPNMRQVMIIWKWLDVAFFIFLMHFIHSPIHVGIKVASSRFLFDFKVLIYLWTTVTTIFTIGFSYAVGKSARTLSKSKFKCTTLSLALVSESHRIPSFWTIGLPTTSSSLGFQLKFLSSEFRFSLCQQLVSIILDQQLCSLYCPVTISCFFPFFNTILTLCTFLHSGTYTQPTPPPPIFESEFEMSFHDIILGDQIGKLTTSKWSEHSRICRRLICSY